MHHDKCPSQLDKRQPSQPTTQPPTANLPNERTDANAPPSHATTSQMPFLTALLLVAFDENHGPTIEAIAPSDIQSLSRTEQSTLAVHALPDSAAIGASPTDIRYVLHLPRPNHSLFAHVLFRQAPDPHSKRGAFQKAVVLVSSVPCLGLPDALLSLIAPSIFEQGALAVRHVWGQVSTWPSLTANAGGNRLELVACRGVISVSVPPSFPRSFAAPAVHPGNEPEAARPSNSPKAVQQQHSEEQSHPDQSPQILHLPLVHPLSTATAAPFHEINLAAAMHGVCDKLCIIWELVALAEPIVVRAATPSQSAAAVLAIVGLLHPLPFVGDWRPYLAIQDTTYHILRRASNLRAQCPDGAVYGVTNRVIVDSLSFPHVLTVGPEMRQCAKPGLASAHRPSLHRSRVLTHALSAALTPPAKRDRRTNSQIAHDVRACVFEKITRPFLRAFDRYLVPTWGEGRAVTAEPYASDPFGRRLGLIAFDPGMFPTVEDLASPGVMALFKKGAISKNRVKALYARFAAGPVFRSWWKEARAAAARECVVLHRTDVIEACVRGTGIVLQQLAEDEAGDAALVDNIVDLCLRVQEEKREAAEDDFFLRGKLSNLLELLVKPLPEEVRVTIRLSFS